MKNPLVLVTVMSLTLAACQQQAGETAANIAASDGAMAEAKAPRALGSGIDTDGFNTSVRAQDDFFEYVNGTWIENTEIPADKARWGAFDALREQSEEDIRALVEEVSAAEEVAHDSPTQKIRDFYNSYMDIETATALGIEAIREELDEIGSIADLDDVYRIFASLAVYGVNAPIGGGIFSDMKDPDVNTIYIVQAGLTMPDRDYYLLDDEQFVKGRREYLEYATAVFEKAGFDNAADRADGLLALETRFAEHHWTKEENRDWSKRYNPKNLDELAVMSPDINWNLLLDTAGFGGRDQYLVSQPSFFEALSGIMTETPLETWKDYLAFQTISNFAPVMGEEWFTLNFNFFRKGLSGVEEPRPLWKRAVNSVSGNMGELLGQLYVDKHFPEDAKARMDTMIENLIKAYEVSINELEWMSDETRQQALDKLSKFRPMVGYPDKWIDYTNLEVVEGDLIANIRNSARFAYNRELDKLDKPVDKTEWQMTPQTVNAYYNPVWNVIVFPAAILQPPFFNVEADDAVNYGGIGAGIGHEIGHGFDDAGSRFDGDGVLRNWWTDEDRAAFDVRKNALAAQYDGYEVIDGLTINGQFTSGENIGDLGGLSIAYKAYRMSLEGEEAPVIDGFTGDQRFFLGWAQVWRAKARPEETKLRLTSDPHSPAKFRTNGAAVNVPEFYTAFDVQEGDGMYLSPEERVRIW